jgi:hypothetical protein
VFQGSVDRVEAVFSTVFIASIFYGDLYFGITVPLAALILVPLGVCVLIQNGTAVFKPTRPALILVGILVIPMLQAVCGWGPTRSDIGSYLPIIYAAPTVQVFSFVRMTDRQLRRALISGAILLAAIMLWSIMFVPPNVNYIPGQDPATTEKLFSERMTAGNRSHANNAISASPQMGNTMPNDNRTPVQPKADSPSSASSDIGDATRQISDQGTLEFYRYKQTVKSPLGASNYIALFFLFVFSVCLFSAAYAPAIVFAALTVATQSRFGEFFLAIPMILVFVRASTGKRITWIKRLVIAALLLVIVGAILVYATGLYTVGGQSVDARFGLAQSALAPIFAHPLIGQPRAHIVLSFGYPANWHPHNAILWIVSSLGLIGLALYAIYLLFAAKLFWRRHKSPTWAGIGSGFVVLAVWSMVEVVSLTPAVELLLASCVGLAMIRGEGARAHKNNTSDCTKSTGAANPGYPYPERLKEYS